MALIFHKKQSTLCIYQFQNQTYSKKSVLFFLDHLYFPQIYFSGIYIYIPMNIHAIAKKQAKHEVLFQFLFYGLIPTNFLSSIYNIFHSTFSFVSY